MNRTALIYVATLLIMVPLDILFLGFVAKGFFQSQVGDMLGPLRPLPGLLFYLLYGVGIVVFVNGAVGADLKQVALLGALFGLVAYGTFDLTSLAVLRHWTWPVAAVDMVWGAFVTALSASAGLALARVISKAV